MKIFKKGDRVYFIANGRHDTGTVSRVTDNLYRVKWDFADNYRENLETYLADELELCDD